MKSALPGKKGFLFLANSEPRLHRSSSGRSNSMNGKSHLVRFPVPHKYFWESGAPEIFDRD
jgi:hypothetical protein